MNLVGDIDQSTLGIDAQNHPFHRCHIGVFESKIGEQGDDRPSSISDFQFAICTWMQAISFPLFVFSVYCFLINAYSLLITVYCSLPS
jgi:hypothetical protein